MGYNGQSQASVIEYEITAEWSRIFVPVGTEFVKVMNESVYPASHVSILWNCPVPPESTQPDFDTPGFGIVLDKYLIRVGSMSLSDGDPNLAGAELAGILFDGLHYTQGVWLYRVGSELVHAGDPAASEPTFVEVPINGVFTIAP